MNARPVPMAETHKLALLDWLRSRARYGQGSPSDRDIARRLGLRTTDDAMMLVQALADDGAITIEREGNFRYLVLAEIVPPADARRVTHEMVEAVKATVPMPAAEAVAVRGKPAPISIAPPPPLFTPIVIVPAPIAAPAPAPAAPPTAPMEIIMSTVDTPTRAERHKIHLNVPTTEHALIRQRAEAEGVALATWALDAVRTRLKETPPAGKPRLSARVIRVANADGREFWAAISTMIELGATYLQAQKAGRG